MELDVDADYAHTAAADRRSISGGVVKCDGAEALFVLE